MKPLLPLLAPLCALAACSSGGGDDSSGGGTPGDRTDGGEPVGPGDGDGGGLPACGDGADNDGDGLADLGDPGCDDELDDDESNPLEGECGPGVRYEALAVGAAARGTLAAGPGDQVGDCGGLGLEAIYRVQIDAPGRYAATTLDPETTADTDVYIRSDCTDAASEAACGAGGEGEPGVAHADLAPGVWFVFVDAASSRDKGPFVVRVVPVLAEGAACDPEEPAQVCDTGLGCREQAGAWACRGEKIGPSGQCADGEDNDGDGLADFPDDPGCQGAEDDDESDTCGGVPFTPIPPASGGVVTGATCDEEDEFRPPCPGSGGAPERLLRFDLRADVVSLRLDVEADFATVLYLTRDDCTGGMTLGCEAGDAIEFRGLLPGPLFFVVDGAGRACGTFTARLTGEFAGGGACDPEVTGFIPCELDPTRGYRRPCLELTEGGGDWVCRVPRCDDRLDNDDPPDGLVDFPADPDCESRLDNDESG